MLETLVSSKIRRAVLGYLLTHAEGHFYLRGLAKELGLAISPLRRELKLMERQGLLKAHQEGNMLFYLVDQRSARFAELRSLGTALGLAGSPELPQPVPAPLELAPVAAPLLAPVLPAAEPPHPAAAVTRAWDMWRGVGWGALGMALMGMTGYLMISHQQLMELARRTARAPAAQVSVVTDVMPHASPASGELRGSRWRLLPGAVGGFAPGRSTVEGSY